MERYMRVGEAAKRLHVSRFTINAYVKRGLLEHETTPGGQAVFTQAHLDKFLGKELVDNTVEDAGKHIVFYVRDSTGIEGNLNAQIDKLTALYGEPERVYKDMASGLNENRPRFKKMIQDAEAGKIDVICITAKDRLTRFGYTYVEKIFDLLDVKIEILDKDLVEKEPHEELMQDFMSLIASFSGKFYRMRSNQHKKMLLDRAREEIDQREVQKADGKAQEEKD